MNYSLHLEAQVLTAAKIYGVDVAQIRYKKLSHNTRGKVPLDQEGLFCAKIYVAAYMKKKLLRHKSDISRYLTISSHTLTRYLFDGQKLLQTGVRFGE